MFFGKNSFIMNPSFIYSNKKTWLIVAICFLLILENVHHFKLKGQSRINCRIKTKLTYILFNPPPKKNTYMAVMLKYINIIK